MDWVKRNLAFVVGGAVSLALLILSGFYLYSNYKKNNDAKTQLEREYNELKRLSALKPHPGKGNVDNIRRAQDQKERLLKVAERVRGAFEPIPAIPNSERVTGEEFSAELRRTLDYLTRMAGSTSVMVPTNYGFSFEAEKRLVKFAPGSLNRLAAQLGEVKVISEILFQAKVNKLTGLRRERVSADDFKGPQTDYIPDASVTNELAIISPYEISFESFSAELSDVMTGFANSPHGIVIKGLNVRPAATAAASTSRYGFDAAEAGEGATPIYSQPYVPPAPTYTPPAGGDSYRPNYNPEAEFGGAYGARPGAIRQPTFNRPQFDAGGGAADSYGIVRPTFNQPAAGYGATYGQPQTAYPSYAAPGTAYAAPVAGTSQTLIDEQPLGVTMVVEVIKLLPPAPEE